MYQVRTLLSRSLLQWGEKRNGRIQNVLPLIFFTTAYLFVFLPFAIKSDNLKAWIIQEGVKGMEYIL